MLMTSEMKNISEDRGASNLALKALHRAEFAVSISRGIARQQPARFLIISPKRINIRRIEGIHTSEEMSLRLFFANASITSVNGDDSSIGVVVDNGIGQAGLYWR